MRRYLPGAIPVRPRNREHTVVVESGREERERERQKRAIPENRRGEVEKNWERVAVTAEIEGRPSVLSLSMEGSARGPAAWRRRRRMVVEPLSLQDILE